MAGAPPGGFQNGVQLHIGMLFKNTVEYPRQIGGRIIRAGLHHLRGSDVTVAAAETKVVDPVEIRPVIQQLQQKGAERVLSFRVDQEINERVLPQEAVAGGHVMPTENNDAFRKPFLCFPGQRQIITGIPDII